MHLRSRDLGCDSMLTKKQSPESSVGFAQIVVCLIVTLIMVFALSACGGEDKQKKESEATLEERDSATLETPEGTLTLKTATDALNAGNDFYKEGKFDIAELCYQHGLKKNSSMWTLHNNLGLTYLQKGQNEKALAYFRTFIPNLSTGTFHWSFYTNYLIAAHANNLPACTLFEDFEKSEKQLEDFAEKAEYNPDMYMKLFLAVYYNAVYMDMELEYDLGLDNYFNYKPLGYTDEQVEGLRQEKGAAWLDTILADLNARNKKYFGEDDPDIGELQSYFAASNA